ncbi:3-phosphoglycerate dehydrogenase [Thiomicrorhabdus sp. 6S2-11]|uniref:D-3-phosphoglycerate dehydrogenase n=1 Tax=Thiomicrorhabdus marina TaxID=2818442 RepID=A0ABS3Q7B5_9GAMM|nr:3-phosphoglycerate dehydrogenase family protein [Thiomicrorhabdus marina]MBO1927700.1 3-phosphoglycerate dehydrogenase [Thiomicrorhabdus marina]
MQISLLNHFSKQVPEHLQSLGYELLSEDKLQQANAIVLRSKSLHEHHAGKSLFAIARAGAGVNNIPIERFSEQGIAVFNAPGANANAVAEMVLTGILMQTRKVAAALNFSQQLFSDEREDYAAAMEKGKAQFQGRELQGLRLGIIGLGAIGVLLANKANALGMQVLGFDPHISVENAWRLSAEVQQCESLSDLLANCDCVSVHVPYLPATHHLLSFEQVAYLPKHAFVINFSRAEVVDQEAITAAIESGNLDGYITDFPNPVLQSHPQVLCFPHLGASTVEAQENASMQVLTTLDNFLKRGEVKYSVNLPVLQPGPIPVGASRLVIIHRNTVGMIAQITDCIEAAEENILEMNNRSRAEMALTVIDLAAAASASLLSTIQAVPNVLSARYC